MDDKVQQACIALLNKDDDNEALTEFHHAIMFYSHLIHIHLSVANTIIIGMKHDEEGRWAELVNSQVIYVEKWIELEEWHKAGSFWPRGIELFMINVDMVMKFGFEDESLRSGEKCSAMFRKYLDKIKIARKSYGHFKDRYPHLHEHLEQCLEYDKMVIFDLCTNMMSTAAKKIRKANSSTVKPRMLDYIMNNLELDSDDVSLDPPIAHKDDKGEHGFHHPMTTQYLIPRGHYSDYLFDTQDTMKKLKTGEIAYNAGVLPAFLFDLHQIHSKNLYTRFMRGQVICCMYQAIFCSPSAGFDKPATSTQGGNAKIHGLDAATEPTLAYVVLQTWFGLSDMVEWGTRHRKFNLEAFYRNLVGILEDMPSNFKTNLLKWYEEEVFQDVKSGGDVDKKDPNSEVASLQREFSEEDDKLEQKCDGVQLFLSLFF
uniref:Uncharacterized protein n=1 Tax=Moniliophthora roreri TaxID=221103 RepID=A0A0W0F9H9_MONRR